MNAPPTSCVPPLITQTHHLQTLISTTNSLPQLKQIHAHLLKSPLLLQTLSSPFITKLLSLSYALDYAASAFLISPSPSPPLSSRILRLLSRSPDVSPFRALLFYARIRRHGLGLGLDRYCFPPVLRAAARAGSRIGREIHGVLMKAGVDSDPFVETALVGFYAAVGCDGDARRVFDRMPYRDLVAWSVMLDGCVSFGHFFYTLISAPEFYPSSYINIYIYL